MADAMVAKVRSPLAETTNRMNSPFPASEQQTSKPSRYVRSDVAHLQLNQHPAPHSRPGSRQAMAPPNMTLSTQMSGVIHHPYPQPVEDDKRMSQASYASTSSSRSKKNYKTHIGPWQLGRTLGKGSSARVRLCRHNITNQLAAVKIVNRTMAYLVQDSSMAALSKWDSSLPDQINGEMRVPMAIEREVAILKLIEHPNIMKLYDIWENRSEIYLILEYIDQGDLFTFINSRGRLPEELSIYFFRQMMSAISYCHSFNVCHRDLKPENILITADLQIKIADFGMAALHQTATHQLATACGSPHYAAPELLKNRQYRGDRADIWSMGVILYAMLSATLPFDDPDLRVMMAKTKKGQYEMPKGLSPEAEDLIRRMLQVNPDRRIAMKDIWRHPLVQKYKSLDDFGDNTAQLPDTRKGFQYAPVARGDIDPQLLRQLRSMWHMFSEHDLVFNLTSKEPNDQKAFYWLLYNYRNKQLEDFKPELAHSMSDYHHLKPAIWKRRVSTCQFEKPRANGHGRSISRFTVISNAPDTGSDGYDPYRSNRVLQNRDSQVTHAKITVHRDGEIATTTATGQANKMRNGANARRMRANSTRASLTSRPQSSRGSLASLRSSRQGTPKIRVPSLRRKRGVDFSHIRKGSDSAGTRSRLANGKTGSDIVAGNGTPHRVPAPAGRFPSPDLTKTADGTYPKALGGPINQYSKKNGASMIFREELRKFSNTCAKDCDEAFKTSIIVYDSECDSSTTEGDRAHRESNPFSVSLDSPATTISPATDSSHDSWHSRPLPPLPKITSTQNKTAVSNKSDVRSTSPDKDVAKSGDRKDVSKGSALPRQVDRRAVSAPAYSQAHRKLSTLPSINENAGLHGDGARIVSAPPQSPMRRANAKNRSMDYLSKVERTIRVVNSPTHGGPPRLPKPVDTQTAKRDGCSRHPLHQQISYDDVECDDHIYDVESAPKKKKSSWFKRVSKADSSASSSDSGARRASGSTDSKQNRSYEECNEQNKKRNFSFPSFWKGNKDKDTGMTIEGLEDVAEKQQATGQAVRRRQRSGVIPSNSGDAPYIEVKQNWLTRLFRVKPATRYLCMTLTRQRARQEVVFLLRDWQRYGIRDIHLDKQRNVILARLGAKNCRLSTI
ncbi:Serine/threonine-protein kinase domain protein [Metarhizium album ARSEF 1941]|uniref:non-specific serine/threonine protein kinase n=1 Tax=Metarhizium album (strain ARSEF 1941) TaxID=1081103 RepID=A0A0B2WXR2_METAS|nr:Serine/threonine-protein kinase domain protein [Metarhizium album ARSEF 1941]KHN98813.1 Serine/threonine-protein kinase domain protein [Metarhizium album ARSEF 1941]